MGKSSRKGGFSQSTSQIWWDDCGRRAAPSWGASDIGAGIGKLDILWPGNTPNNSHNNRTKSANVLRNSHPPRWRAPCSRNHWRNDSNLVIDWLFYPCNHLSPLRESQRPDLLRERQVLCKFRRELWDLEDLGPQEYWKFLVDWSGWRVWSAGCYLWSIRKVFDCQWEEHFAIQGEIIGEF